MIGWGWRMGAVALLSAVSACEVIDRTRGAVTREREPVPAESPGAGLSLNLEAPGTVRLGEETAIHLSVTNHADTAVSAVRLELLLPAWMEPLVPEPEGTEVSMVASGAETRLAYPFAARPLKPGESRGIVQRIRAPDPSVGPATVFPGGIRATLVGADGQPLGAQVESRVDVDPTAADARTGSADSAASATVTGEGVGPVRLRMSAAELRRVAPASRDTSWTAQGSARRGVTVPLGRTHVTAELSEGRTSRLYVHDRSLRTPEGLGVGSRMRELRAQYGQGCADVDEGSVVAWFPDRPGVTWVLDTPVPPEAERMRAEPQQIPATATVVRMRIHEGSTACP